MNFIFVYSITANSVAGVVKIKSLNEYFVFNLSPSVVFNMYERGVLTKYFWPTCHACSHIYYISISFM